MLVKEQGKRIKIKELLQHPWIVKANPTLAKLRKEAKKEKEFEMFSLVNPGSKKAYDEVTKKVEEDKKSVEVK